MLLPSDATEIQIAIGVIDGCQFYCGIFGDGDCHSHAPLIDNVRVLRIDTPGPIWNPNAWTAGIFYPELFQDNFFETTDYTHPGTGEFTSAGKVRVDIGEDANRFDIGRIIPSDSLTIIVLEPYMGLDRNVPGDPASGAIVSQETFNADSAAARVILSGFSYFLIYADQAQNPYKRAVHLQRILECLGNTVYIGAKTVPGLTYSLAQNYPNPFNPSTTIRYSIYRREHVSLKIYNVAGQLVKTLVEERKNPGPHAILWRGRNNAGDPVSNGIYLYRLVTKNSSQTKKMIMLK